MNEWQPAGPASREIITSIMLGPLGTTWNEKRKTLEQALLDALEACARDRDALSKVVDAPRSTVYYALKELIRRGQVAKFTSTERARGRPRVLYKLVSPAPDASKPLGDAHLNPQSSGIPVVTTRSPARGEGGKAGLTLNDICRYPGNDCNDACPSSVEDCIEDLKKALQDPDGWLRSIARSREEQCEFARGFYCTATDPPHVCDLDHNTFKSCSIRADRIKEEANK